MIDNLSYRSTIFRHLDGLVTVPVAYALYKKGVLDYLLKIKKLSLAELTSKFKANEGYLNVGLRTLASQGFIDYTIQPQTNEISIVINSKSAIAFQLFPLYKEAVEMLLCSSDLRPNLFEGELFDRMQLLFKKYQNNYGITFFEDEFINEIQQQILTHIEGFLVGQIVVRLGMNGVFHKYFMEVSFCPEEFHKKPENIKVVLDFLTHLGWFSRKNGNYQFTEKGLFFAKRASAYGVTVSYLPTFRKIDELLFGDASCLRIVGEGKDEIHVDREMNVWGSGGAHDTYFKVVDEIIIKLFNLPIEEQPKGILDMGCGNGAFIEHVFNVIERQTFRGELLNNYPLFLVGADYNQASLKVTRANLINADIWAKVIWGDIGQPDCLAKDLLENYNIDLKDLLNVRTFLDHNRIWESPKIVSPERISKSTGAFAYRGDRIPNNLVEDNLLEHLKKWAPYVHKFGLLIIELHTLSTDLAARNIGKTIATAYDTTHGFSDQYIVEIEVLHKIAAEAGLYSDPIYFKKFPDSDLAAVSVNLLKGV